MGKPVAIEYESPRVREEVAEAPILSQKQMEEVATRLGDLSYLD